MMIGAVLLGIIHFSGWLTPVPSLVNLIVVLLGVMTFVIYVYLLRWHQKSPQLFTQFYLLSIAIKIVAYGAFVGWMVYYYPDQARPNTVLFLITYVLLTLLEVVFLFRKVNRS